MSANRKSASSLRGLKIGRGGAATWISALARPLLARKGMVAYSAVSEVRIRLERRTEDRRTVHLQGGKILNCRNQFLAECLIRNRTRTGVRLKLAANVTLPSAIQLYDDCESTLVSARVMWQRGRDAGCRINSKPQVSDEKLLSRLRERYYAVR